MEGETAGSRRKRKEEAKLLKRQRIEQSGGVRPRKADGAATVSLSSPPTNERQEADTATTLPGKQRPSTGSDRQGDNRRNGRTNTVGNMFNGRSSQTAPSTSSSSSSSSHRFGRVMDSVPCRNQPRLSTVSIAIPGSVVANCQTRELKTQISGQIARSATIYHVDEIIVFDDKLSKSESSHRRTFVPNRNSDGERRRPNGNGMTAASDNSVVPTTNHDGGDNDDSAATAAQRPRASTDPHAFLARILQYCECPQYLRRHFFPMHPDLQFAGLLAPIDAPHHVRADDRSPFREGVVLDKTHAQKGSLVNCGVYKRPVHIDQRLQPGIRCTVQLDPVAYGRPGPLHGTVVSPSLVTERDGTYWGYTVRLASSIKAVFDECPYEEGTYDLTIGTSERGNETVDDARFSLRNSKQRHNNPIATATSNTNTNNATYRHALIVFGGVAGIEECVDADESLKLAGSASSTMFDKWINICPFQGSRTIRSEEAVLIALAKLSPFLAEAACKAAAKPKQESASQLDTSAAIHLTDEVSDESSDDDRADNDEGDE